MSNECSAIVWKRDFGGASRKLIAARLADHADDEGRGIWPSVERVAAQCNVSPRTVQRVLADFVDEKILVIVDEGGRGRGSTRRYDFNMAVVKGLPVAKWKPDEPAEIKGDTVSPLESQGDNEAPKGDSGDVLGCHGDTQTAIEPPVEPPVVSVRERAGEEEGENRKAVEKAFERAWQAWPTSVGNSRPDAWKAWLALTPAERVAAAEEAQRYVAAVRAVHSKVCAHSKYLSERRWIHNLPPKPEAAAEPVEAKPLGKAWMALWYQGILGGPDPRFAPRLTSWEQSLVDQGKADAQELLRQKVTRDGYPEVKRLNEGLRYRTVPRVEPALAALAADFKAVHVGDEIWEAWKALHAERGWPWLPDLGWIEWVHFPPGGPDGLKAFEEAVKALGGGKA